MGTERGEIETHVRDLIESQMKRKLINVDQQSVEALIDPFTRGDVSATGWDRHALALSAATAAAVLEVARHLDEHLHTHD